MRYYGRGPHENQWDRKTGSDVGVYSSTVAEQWTGYLRPQENGNKTDVRWVALVNGSGRGLLAYAEPLLEVTRRTSPRRTSRRASGTTTS